MSTVGQKIYIWQFKDRDLHGIAFIDAQIYCHQVGQVGKKLIFQRSFSLYHFDSVFLSSEFGDDVSFSVSFFLSIVQ